jgi:hypothetical protein
MSRQDMCELYDQLKQLEQHLKDAGAPRTITARAHNALLAVNWGIDNANRR